MCDARCGCPGPLVHAVRVRTLALVTAAAAAGVCICLGARKGAVMRAPLAGLVALQRGLVVQS